MDDWHDAGIHCCCLLRILGHPTDIGLIAGGISISYRYEYAVTWSEEDEEFVGLCSEFPSLSWLASTQNEAFSGIRSVVADVVEDMLSNDEEPPAPIADRNYSGKFIVRVPPEMHRALVTKAAEQGVSLNRLVNARLSNYPTP